MYIIKLATVDKSIAITTLDWKPSKHGKPTKDNIEKFVIDWAIKNNQLLPYSAIVYKVDQQTNEQRYEQCWVAKKLHIQD